MLISLNWLKEYVDLDITVEELTDRLTMLGLEIEQVIAPGKDISGVIIGQILEIAPHPDADKLVVCKTDVGGEAPLQIVCGAKNMKPGDRVPTAAVGATLPGGFEIGRRKMRGIESQGMMCSSRELGLGEDHSGLMILSPDAPIGMDAKTYLGLDDIIFEIEVTPNRGDWASMIGVARELAAYYGKELRIPQITLTESGPDAAGMSSVTIENPDLCPRYAGRVLTNVKVGPSPQWMVTRLTAAGQRSINNIVDITNYVLLETGHPLHAFDYNLLAENRIIVRTAAQGERIRTLDGAERNLTEAMLVIADAKQAQAVAGIMGGGDSEVGDSTTTIFLESAVFQPSSVRRTARQLSLLTEAAQHFQRGADPEMSIYALNRAAQLMQELAGAAVAPGIIDAHPQPQAPRSVTLRFARTKSLLGAEMAQDYQCAILERLGFHATAVTETQAEFLAPTWRHDVTMESDLIEELARFYGYDQLPVTLPPVRPAEKVFAPHESRLRALRQTLVERGLTEVYNWTFSSPAAVQRTGLPESYADMVMLQNPLTENFPGMRTSLMPGLLTVAEYNVKRGAQRLAIFEMGPVYKPSTDVLPAEPTSLSILLAGSAQPGHWAIPARSFDLYDLKGFMEDIAAFLGLPLTATVLDDTTWTLFQQGQSATVNHGETPVGVLGKVSRTTLKAFDIPFDAYVLELNLAALLSAPVAPAQFQAIPSYPPSLRDLALVVNRDIPAGALLETVRQRGGELLRETRIFDVYSGKQLPADKKSIALSLVFQSPERTLTDAETQKALDNIIQALSQDHGATLR